MIDNTALQEAIAYFEDAVRESDEIIEDCSPDLQRDLTEQKEHFVVALEAMRRAEPANEPLTLAELREVEQTGEGIYVCTLDGDPIFRGKPYTAAVIDKTAAFGTMGYHLQAIYGRGLTLTEGDYGKTWLAYRRKLEPEGGTR